MEAIKFMKMDFLKMKTQIKLIVLTVAVVLLFTGKMGSLWGAMYMIFMGLIFCSVPFSIDSMSGESFMKLLPAKAQHRVYGRFCFSVAFLGICSVLISLTYIKGILGGEITASYIFPKIIMILSVGLCMNAIQYVFSYFFEIKNQQLLSIMRMVPGFVFFFAGSYLIDTIAAMPKGAVEALGEVVNYGMTHQQVVAAVTLAVALVFNGLCAVICGKREAMKEA